VFGYYFRGGAWNDGMPANAAAVPHLFHFPLDTPALHAVMALHGRRPEYASASYRFPEHEEVRCLKLLRSFKIPLGGNDPEVDDDEDDRTRGGNGEQAEGDSQPRLARVSVPVVGGLLNLSSGSACQFSVAKRSCLAPGTICEWCTSPGSLEANIAFALPERSYHRILPRSRLPSDPWQPLKYEEMMVPQECEVTLLKSSVQPPTSSSAVIPPPKTAADPMEVEGNGVSSSLLVTGSSSCSHAVAHPKSDLPAAVMLDVDAVGTLVITRELLFVLEAGILLRPGELCWNADFTLLELERRPPAVLSFGTASDGLATDDRPRTSWLFDSLSALQKGNDCDKPLRHFRPEWSTLRAAPPGSCVRFTHAKVRATLILFKRVAAKRGGGQSSYKVRLHGPLQELRAYYPFTLWVQGVAIASVEDSARDPGRAPHVAKLAADGSFTMRTLGPFPGDYRGLAGGDCAEVLLDDARHHEEKGVHPPAEVKFTALFNMTLVMARLPTHGTFVYTPYQHSEIY